MKETYNANIKLCVRRLNISYKNFQALKNINIDIYKNKITALIGPSGCGKSTFLKSLNRMNEDGGECHVSGKILFDGSDIYNYDIHNLRKRIGMIFQKPTPFPMSIYENIVYGPRIHGIKSKKILDEIVETSLKQASVWMEIKDKLKKNAMELSGGQQQRLCIARAIAVKPEVLLMDEPTSSLDPISTVKIENLASELKNDYTIVIVTHDMRQAKQLSDYTALFMEGELVQFEKTCKIFKNPENYKTENFIKRKI